MRFLVWHREIRCWHLESCQVNLMPGFSHGSVMIIKYSATHAPYPLGHVLCPHSPDFITRLFPLLSPTHHIFCHLSHHLTHHLTCHPPCHLFSLIQLLHVWSHVMPAVVVWHAWQWAPPSSLQIHRATAPRLQDELSPRLLLPVLALSVSHPYASIFFMIHYILFCKLSPTCFIPHLLDYRWWCSTWKPKQKPQNGNVWYNTSQRKVARWY